MDFRNYLEKNRNSRKKISKQQPVLEEQEEHISICKENSERKMSEMNRNENKFENLQNKRRYLGEVSELPSASEFDEGTFIKKGQTVYIKQDGLWESLIEGGVVTREVVKYGVPGGGCGVSEVKQLINENALTKGTGEGYQGTFVGTFNTEADLPAVSNPGDFATTRNGVFYVWGV